MKTTEHISTEAMARYCSKTSEAPETLVVQSHIAACEACRERLAQAIGAGAVFSSLKNNFSFDDFAGEPEHLPYEQLALFVDEKLDDVDREIAESHLFVCAECSADAADLRSYRKIADAPSTQTVQTETKSFWQRLFAFDSIGSFAPVAAILLVTVLFGAWFLIRSNRIQEIVQTNTNQTLPSPIASLSPIANDSSPNANTAPNVETNQNAVPPINQSEPLLALNDGQITVDETGNVRGLENLSPSAQKAIRQSLQSGKVPTSSVVISSGGGILMGGGSEDTGVPFALASPIGKIVREQQPVLRWKPLKDATDYSVAIVDDKFRVVAESGKLTGTNWKPSKPLPRGATYSWQVTATKTDGTETVSPSSPAPQAKFRVLDNAAQNEIAKLENSAAKSHLALGVLYAQNGLNAEAKREFEILVQENPKSAIARKLLASVKGKSK